MRWRFFCEVSFAKQHETRGYIHKLVERIVHFSAHSRHSPNFGEHVRCRRLFPGFHRRRRAPRCARANEHRRPRRRPRARHRDVRGGQGRA